MAIKSILFFVGVFLFLGCRVVWAEVIINEVQIGGVSADDEFIELYNSSNSDIDLTNWYINKKSSTGSETTLISKSHFKDKIVSHNSYLLLAKENGYVGNIIPDVLWPNSYSLANNNSIVLYRGSEIDKNEINWENIDNNKSTQRQPNNSWIIASSTPKAQNVDTTATQGSNNTPNGLSTLALSSSTQTSTEPKTKTVEIPKIKTKISTENVAFIEMPVDFIMNTTGYTNEPTNHGKYFLNFGDGTSEEIKIKNIVEKIQHIFFYEGEYVVSLEYYQNYFEEIPSATDRIIVKVIPVSVAISRVGDEGDFFIEVTNNTDFDVDISRWIISSDTKSFIFPKNTILDFKKKIILSPKITGFSILDKESLKLRNSQWETIFDYSDILKPVSVSTKNIISKISKSNFNENSQNISPTIGLSSDSINIKSENMNFPPLNLEAEAIKGGLNTKDNFIYEIGLLFFLVFSAGGAYFIRISNRKKVIQKMGEDFEIIDE